MDIEQEFQKLTIENVANGAVPELFDHAMQEVMKNIQDENRNPTEVRKIAMVFEIKSNKERNMAQVGVQVQTKLAPVESTESAFFFRNEKGRPVAYSHNIHQPSLFDKPNVIEMGKDR